MSRVLLALALAAIAATTSIASSPDKVRLAHGRHLVDIACGVCHSPRDPKTNQAVPGDLSGGKIGRLEKDVGVFYPPNLTPDKNTGLGAWTADEIATAIRKGVRPDGRVLVKAMPSSHFAQVLSNEEVVAIVAYLRSLKAVNHKVPDPVGIGQNATTPYYGLMPPGVVR